MWLLLQLLLQLLRTTTTTTTTGAAAATATYHYTARHGIYIVICSVHYASAQSRHKTLWQNAWWWIYRHVPFKSKHRYYVYSAQHFGNKNKELSLMKQIRHWPRLWQCTLHCSSDNRRLCQCSPHYTHIHRSHNGLGLDLNSMPHTHHSC